MAQMSHGNKSLEHVLVPEGSKIHIEEAPKKRKPRHYYSFAKYGVTNERDRNSMQALQVIGDFNKAELLLLKIMDTRIRKDNSLFIDKSKLTDGDRRKIEIAIKSWLDKHLLIRTKREHYIVSPYFMVPNIEFHESIKKIWDRGTITPEQQPQTQEELGE